MSRSILELRHLRTLVALHASGSLSRAAEHLFLTQSALSHQLKAMTALYGTPLIEPDTRPLRFTPSGQRLLALAQDLLPRVADAERDLARLAQGQAGPLRVAVECHTCFDWLMPAMDSFRGRWPEVELDLVSGFHSEPVGLLERGEAEFVVIHDQPPPRAGIVFHPLFEYETLALMAPKHRLAEKPYLRPEDFADETLIAYPVEDAMLDVMKHVLLPAGIHPRRRNAELTVAILQLAASGRGIAALPAWSVVPYLARGYIKAKRIGPDGLHCALFGATTAAGATTAYLQEFVEIIQSGHSLTDSNITDAMTRRSTTSRSVSGRRVQRDKMLR